MIPLISALVAAIFAIILVASAVRMVKQSRVGMLERFGKYRRTLQPGLHIVVPLLDRVGTVVDMRETVQAFAPQPVITQDNVTIAIDTVVYYQVTDPFRATYEVGNFLNAMEQLAQTTLRNLVGAMTLEEAFTSRDQINTQLRIVLDEATEKWGVRVTRVELKSIDPPRSIQEAMEQQMRADRAKRAAILSAEGEKQAAILRAEGQRESQILAAEGEQKSNILRAEGDRQARALRAKGEAEALAEVFERVVKAGIAPENMLAYKYLEALPAVADGDATKLMLLPAGASNAMGAIAGLGAAFAEGIGGPQEPAPKRSAPRPSQPKQPPATPPAKPEQ